MTYSKDTNIIKGGKTYYDTPLGILCLESFFPKLRGHMRNPRTHEFPIVAKVMKGINIPKLLFDPSPEMIKPLIEAAQELEREGVHAITGSCGFLALFQKEIAESVNIPVLMSSLLQLPLIRLMHGEKARIGILTASANALTPAHISACGADIKDVLIRGMEGREEFQATIIRGERSDFNMDALENEIVSAALEFIEEEKLDALLLECTDLPPFAEQMQKQSNVPIYDINSLIRLVYSSVQWKF